jgi:hypothetical protein
LPGRRGILNQGGSVKGALEHPSGCGLNAPLMRQPEIVIYGHACFFAPYDLIQWAGKRLSEIPV